MIWILNSVAQKQGLNWLVTSLLYRGLFVSWGRWGEGKIKHAGDSHRPPRAYNCLIIAIFIGILSRDLWGVESLFIPCDLSRQQVYVLIDSLSVIIDRTHRIFSSKKRETNFSPNAPFWSRKLFGAFCFANASLRWEVALLWFRRRGEASVRDEITGGLVMCQRFHFWKKKMFCVASLRLSLRRTALKTAISWSVSVKCLPSRW